MHKKYIILIGGIPAAGKTTYAAYLSETLLIPMICKDHIKECLHDVLKYDPSVRDEAIKHGIAGYGVLFHIAEALMKVGNPLILESNFTPLSEGNLRPLIQKYGYAAMTILFGGDIKTIHERFVQRDRTPERHPGLVSGSSYDEKAFRDAAAQSMDFDIGPPRMKIDATDFGRVSYEDITKVVRAFMQTD